MAKKKAITSPGLFDPPKADRTPHLQNVQALYNSTISYTTHLTDGEFEAFLERARPYNLMGQKL